MGELKMNFNPSFIWLLIGIFDLVRTGCSRESTLIGILSVVEEIRRLQTEPIIVINSLLPRSSYKLNGSLGEENFIWSDLKVINKHLQLYSQTHENVEFFNATDIFLSYDSLDSTNYTPKIDFTLMKDFLYSSDLGYKLL